MDSIKISLLISAVGLLAQPIVTHFNLYPKTGTRTDPKIPDPKLNQKSINIFWGLIYFTRKNRNRKEPIRIDPDPKRTDPNRPDPIKTYLCPT